MKLGTDHVSPASGSPSIAFPLRIAFVRHKAASMWINRIIADASSLMGWSHEYFFESSRFGHSFSDFVARSLSDGSGYDIVTCANPRPDEIEHLPAFRAFHVVRDPRDAILSGYFSHRNSHWFPKGSDRWRHQQSLRSLSQEEGLLREIEFSGQYIDRIAAWDYRLPNVLELKFEEVTASPYDAFLRALGFLGLLDEDSDSSFAERIRRIPGYSINKLHVRYRRAVPLRVRTSGIPGDELLALVYRHRFSRLSGGRTRGEADSTSHQRKGVGGDWVNYFGPQHRAAFGERYGDLVERMGYESSPAWRLVA